MNNSTLLRGLLAATLLSGGACGLTAVGAGNEQVISLEHLFKTAETRSVQLRPAFTAEEEAEQQQKVARSEYLPSIDASLSVSYIGDGFTTARAFSDYQKAPIPHLGNGLAVNLTQPIYTGGAIKAGVELADLQTTAARYATDLRRNNIRFQLTGFYLDIYKYRNLRNVVSQNIDRARKMLAEMQARVEQGVALSNDVTRYELLLSNLELQQIKIDNTLDILNRNLVTIAGLPEETVVIPDSTILNRSLPKTDEAWWRQEALSNSPTLKLARSGVDISRKAESLVKSDRLPKIGLKASWTIDGPILVEVPPINRNLSYWFVGLGVSYNISSLYKTNKSLAKSRIATRRATEEYDAAVENVSLGVRADYIRYLESYEQLKTCDKGAELARRNYLTVSTRYSADMALITDLLDAANSQLDAEQQLVNARIDIIYYYYKLMFTSGKI